MPRSKLRSDLAAAHQRNRDLKNERDAAAQPLLLRVRELEVELAQAERRVRDAESELAHVREFTAALRIVIRFLMVTESGVPPQTWR